MAHSSVWRRCHIFFFFLKVVVKMFFGTYWFYFWSKTRCFYVMRLIKNHPVCMCVYIPDGTKQRSYKPMSSVSIFHKYQILSGCKTLKIWPRCKTFAPTCAYKRKTPAIPSLNRQLVGVMNRIRTLQ